MCIVGASTLVAVHVMGGTVREATIHNGVNIAKVLETWRE
jgi:hypothetical protein